MATNFKDIAAQVLSLSILMEGRTQVKTSEIVGKNLTIIAFDFVTVDKKTYPVVLFKELPDNFYNGGHMLAQLCEAWVRNYDGDTITCSEDLYKAGGVTVRFTEKRTKSGNNFVSVDLA